MSSPLKGILLLMASLLAGPLLFSQEYLGDDEAFFQKKAVLYQRWLEAKGLGESLKIDETRLQRNGMELELLLSLNTHDPDTAAALWTGLEQNFLTANPDLPIGDYLFTTFIRMMEIPAGQGNIQIYFPRADGLGYHPCFYVWVWWENGRIQEENRVNNCRSQPLNIPVKVPQIKVIKKGLATIYQKADARSVFEKVLVFARNRYEREVCEERDPRVDAEELTDYSLKFTVTDLCREVLTEEQKSLWCRLVSRWWGPCNDMRRERLEFEISYIPTEEGYLLKGNLTGKFGSGVYRPRASGYMDMEPDFEEDFLIPYVRQFHRELQQFLAQ